MFDGFKMSSGMVNGESDAGGGGGHHSNPDPEPMTQVPPEIMFKINKKIAQLTKVIYALNTKNDDLELELEHTK